MTCTACGVVAHPEPVSSASEMSRRAEVRGYRLHAGDELEIRFSYTPEFNTLVVVRPDGKVNLPLVGDVAASGMSPAQFVEQAKLRYQPHLSQREISVNVRNYGARRVFVGGQVAHPGVQSLVGQVTVLQAIMVAEGFRDDARTSEVVVIRRAEAERPMVFSLNMDDVISGHDLGQDIVLEPSDIVVVPRSRIGNINLWVDQYIRRNLPIGFNVNYSIVNYTRPVQ